MASGWILWVWLECIGVVSDCCCKEVYRYPHKLLLFPTPLVLALFWQHHPYFFAHFKNVFSFLLCSKRSAMLIVVQNCISFCPCAGIMRTVSNDNHIIMTNDYINTIILANY